VDWGHQRIERAALGVDESGMLLSKWQCNDTTSR